MASIYIFGSYFKTSTENDNFIVLRAIIVNLVFYSSLILSGIMDQSTALNLQIEK